MTYTEPLSTDRFLDLGYNFNKNFAANDKRVFSKTPATGADYLFVDYLSNHYENNYNYNRISAAVRTIKKKYNYTIGVLFQPVLLKGYSVTKDSAFTPIKNFNWFPVARLVYNFTKTKTLNFNYNGSARQPGFDQLQPVLEESSQMNKSIGNPFLKPSTTHSFNTNFNNFNFSSGRIFLVNLSFSFVNDQIVNKLTNFRDSTGKITGATLTKPENVNGYYNSNFFFTYAKPFKNRKYVVSTRSMVNYINNVSLTDDTKNIGHNWIWTQGVDLEYNLKWLEMRTGASYNLNYTDFSVNTAINRLHSLTLSNDGRIDFGSGFILRWDFDYYIYKGLSTSLQQNVAMLNASIEKELFKKKNGILKLAGFDVFKENTNISRTVTENFVTDERTNRLTRYFMISFTYRFNKFKGQAPQQHNFRRMEGGMSRSLDL
jgi:hypothetical protein